MVVGAQLVALVCSCLHPPPHLWLWPWPPALHAHTSPQALVPNRVLAADCSGLPPSLALRGCSLTRQSARTPQVPNAGQPQGREQGRVPHPALRGQQTVHKWHLTGGRLWTAGQESR